MPIAKVPYVAGRAGLRHEGRRAVDVADRQRAAGASAPQLVSVRFRVSDDSTAASLVPRMLTVTEVRVPSALATAKRVGVGGAGHELVVRRVRGVGPGAAGVDREGAVACRPCRPAPRRSPRCRRR